MRILVVDDDAETCSFMKELLAADERHLETAESPGEALALARAEPFDLVIADVNLESDLTGVDLLRRLKRDDPRLEVILMSAFGTLETAVEAARAGAFDYVSKPFDIAALKAIVGQALKRRAEGGPPAQERAPAASVPDGLIGRSAPMIAVYKAVARAAASDVPVLVVGETGTGKELVARAIHHHSDRGGRAFVPVNCGALPEGLIESELFGHVRGSFTGAVTDKKGLFEQAHGGTIFLDEIGDMPAAAQVRLLRVLEQGEVRPVGGSVRSVDARVVAATHRDLERAVADGAFREDLFYRLNVLRVALPPLRERREDVPLLASFFLRAAGERARVSASLTPRALDALRAYPWPGNVRELENVIEQLVAASPGGLIDREALPAKITASRAPRPDDLFQELPPLEELERRYLKHVLAAVNGHRTRAAEVMGIDRRTLYRMAERLGVPLDDDEG
jgi:DNA-binding NtrC family response regulator